MNWKERLNSYREFYKKNNHLILSSNPNKFFSHKILKSVRGFELSPIEEIVWDICLCEGIVLYPQYPIDRYMVDFCNPIKKIILECDGAKFHSIEKDFDRDEYLVDNGYKVFRLSGSKIMRSHDLILEKQNNTFFSGNAI